MKVLSKYIRLINCYFLVGIASLLFSCEKDIDISVPETENKIVIEGSIEQGEPPFVIITKTIGYFEPTDVGTFQETFIRDAVVTVSNGTNTVQLSGLCTDQLPDSLLATVAVLIGISEDDLKKFPFCLYTTLNTAVFGEIGKSYRLDVVAEGQTLNATTTIPEPIPMNNYWYKDQPGFSDYGYLWFNLSDPAGLGNAYRVFTQRKGKDERFIPTDGSVFNDQLIEGLTFDAFFMRGHEPGSEKEEDNNDTSEYYEQGDTIIIKFCTIDIPHFEFWETYEMVSFNKGNPFAAPTTIRTNVDGGLGIWGGYGVTYDTLIAVD